MKISTTSAAVAMLGLASASPLRRSIQRRQVPQDHSHDLFLTITQEFLQLDNPKEILDPVFGLLGNAAAEEGAGLVTNFDCLKQETADQAFTNAKAAGDLRGMAGALLYQAIERNSIGIGLASVTCDEAAVNPEIGALTQHQDAAGEGAQELNKAITLELAKQLAGIGADPLLALLSGTFEPGDPNDNTLAGNTCNDLEPELGCIFSQGLLVLDASQEEIADAVAGIEPTFTGTGGIFATDLVDLETFSTLDIGEVPPLSELIGGGAVANATSTEAAGEVVTEAPAAGEDECTVVEETITEECTLVTETIAADKTAEAFATMTSPVVVGVIVGDQVIGIGNGAVEENKDHVDEVEEVLDEEEDAVADEEEAVVEDGEEAVVEDGEEEAATPDPTSANLQTFTSAVGAAAPAVQSGAGDRPFVVNDFAFDNLASALTRSCDIQNNLCFNAANSGALAGGTAQCTTQFDACKASVAAASSAALRRRQSQLDFGTCSQPYIAKSSSAAASGFQPVNTVDFAHQASLDVSVIGSFICQQLSTVCGASAAAVQQCQAGLDAAIQARQQQQAIDLFNRALGLVAGLNGDGLGGIGKGAGVELELGAGAGKGAVKEKEEGRGRGRGRGGPGGRGGRAGKAADAQVIVVHQECA